LAEIDTIILQKRQKKNKTKRNEKRATAGNQKADY